MTPQEANKIIAIFMGLTVSEDQNGVLCEWVDSLSYGYPLAYNKSLDSLIPVWEKIRRGFNIDLIKSVDNYYCSVNNGEYYKDDARETIQEAACIATAKAINEKIEIE